MSYIQVHHNNNHKREYIEMHSGGNHQLLEDNFNKKLKLDNDEKYKQNLIKFEKLSALLENNYTNVFDVTSKLFQQNGLNEFENIKFYNNVLKNENSLTNGVRLSNISKRIVNKNYNKKKSKNVMKRDGIKSFYDLAYKKKLEQASKLIKNDMSQVSVNTNKPEVTAQPKKSLFSKVATVQTNNKTRRTAECSKIAAQFSHNTKHKIPDLPNNKQRLTKVTKMMNTALMITMTMKTTAAAKNIKHINDNYGYKA
ncbi:hypothetical protein DAHU10_031670 [Hanseniaspora uvarum]|nr:hypothetical protein DAHU10_031670 [Hanseniaspora uvarum]